MWWVAVKRHICGGAISNWEPNVCENLRIENIDGVCVIQYTFSLKLL